MPGIEGQHTRLLSREQTKRFEYYLEAYRRLVDLLPDSPMDWHAAQQTLHSFFSGLLYIKAFCKSYNNLPDFQAIGINSRVDSQDFLLSLRTLQSFIQRQKDPLKNAIVCLKADVDADLKIIAYFQDGLKREPYLLPEINLKKARDFGRNHFARWHGFTFLQAFDYWNAGLQVAEVDDYITIGIRKRSTMSLLSLNGLGINEILNFRQSGIRNPAEMIRLAKYGLTGRKVQDYTEAGIRRIEDIVACFRADLNPVAVADYISAGIRIPAEMIRCRQSGLDGNKIRAFFYAGVVTLDEMRMHSSLCHWPTHNGLGRADSLMAALDHKPTYRQMEINPIDEWGFNRDPQKADKWDSAGFQREEAVAYWKAGFQPSDVAGFRGHMILASEAKQYLKIGITAIDPSMRAGYMTGPLEALESDGSATVYKGMFLSSQGGMFLAVFKGEQPAIKRHISTFIRLSGVDECLPRLSLRSTATYRVNNLLGFSVIPRTELCFHDNRLGIAMAFVKGVHPHRGNFDFDNPGLRREMVSLQFLDHLCAQCDRYEKNYLIDADASGNVSVSGIDNELSFGTNTQDPNMIRIDYRNVTSGIRMPEIADGEIHNRFKALNAAAIRRELALLLTREEIKACVCRLGLILNHLDGLEKKGCIIKPDQWGSAIAAECLSNPLTSYIARDRARRPPGF